MVNEQKHGLPAWGISSLICCLVAIFVWGGIYTGVAAEMPETVKARGEAIVEVLQKIHETSTIFFTVNDRYPQDFKELVESDPPYITAAYVDGTPFGYKYTIVSTNNSSLFMIKAIPLPEEIQGMASYCITENGYVRVDGTGVDISSYDSCKILPGVKNAISSVQE